MSIQSEVDRISGAKETMRTYLTGSGVEVPSAAGIDEMAALLSSVPSGGNVTQYTGTLLADGWEADSYGYQAQTITIAGLQADYEVDPQWDVVLSGIDPDADEALINGFALIHNYKTGANSLTAQCIGSAPSVNIPIKVVVFG